MNEREMEKLAAHLEEELERRYPGKPLLRHIHYVARFAHEIARSNRVPDRWAEKARIAGLAHDLFKGWSQDELRDYIEREGVPIDELSLSFGGGLLHAPAAAHYLRATAGVRDRQLLDAVYYHTTGRPDSTMLDKILFCADYLDPSREIRQAEPDMAELSRRIMSDLEETYPEIVSRKLKYTLSKGKPLHPNGVAAWNQACAVLGRGRKPSS